MEVAISPTEFVHRIVVAVPEAAPAVAEHFEDYDELLLHLLTATLREMAIAAFYNADRELSDRIAAVFDEGLRHGDDGVKNAVSVSFVEDTPWWDAEKADFIASWPPALRSDADEWRKEAEARIRRS